MVGLLCLLSSFTCVNSHSVSPTVLSVATNMNSCRVHIFLSQGIPDMGKGSCVPSQGAGMQGLNFVTADFAKTLSREGISSTIIIQMTWMRSRRQQTEFRVRPSYRWSNNPRQ
jgi:hypothetical protein